MLHVSHVARKVTTAKTAGVPKAKAKVAAHQVAKAKAVATLRLLCASPVGSRDTSARTVGAQRVKAKVVASPRRISQAKVASDGAQLATRRATTHGSAEAPKDGDMSTRSTMLLEDGMRVSLSLEFQPTTMRSHLHRQQGPSGPCSDLQQLWEASSRRSAVEPVKLQA